MRGCASRAWVGVLAAGLCALSGCGSTAASSTAPDAAVSADASVDAGAPGTDDAATDDGNGCLVTSPNADVQVTSPGGVFAARYGAFGIMDGECGGIRIVVATEAHTLTRIGMSNFVDHEAMVVSPRTYDPDTRTWVSGPARVSMFSTLVTGASADIVIDEYVPPWPMTETEPRLRASFTLAQEGWAGGGTVDLHHCPGLDIYCP